jgi:2-dehydro-3-deoxyphosphooctonate aldolase (KDO 8-P synthase)
MDQQSEPQREVTIATPGGGRIVIGNRRPLAFILGPCVIESRDHALMMADRIAALAARHDVPVIYKSSFDKANRTSGRSFRGVSLEAALPIFEAVKAATGLPVLTDVHEREQCAIAAEVVDVLQIPAFLCRQTDLLVAAAATGRVVNVKKGQFLAPWDMGNVAAKLTAAGTGGVLLTERGASFGYNTLVVDMRALPIMAATGHPVIFDATHSVQQPGGRGDSSGGQREYAPALARASAAVGVAGVFMETHDDPDHAPSDGPNMIPLDQLGGLIATLKRLDAVAKDATLP